MRLRRLRKKVVSTIALLSVGLLGVSPTVATAGDSASVSIRSENPVGPDHVDLVLEEGLEDAAVKTTPSGKQVEWMIQTPDSSHSRSFSVDAPGDVRLEKDKKSGAVLVYSDSEPYTLINSPWAKDATGKDLSTYYEISGNQVTQIVVPDADTSYPIVSDPRVNWGIVSGHIYFSKEETRRMAAGAAAVAAISPFWFAVPPPLGQQLAIWWGGHSILISGWATAAHAQNKCLSLKVGAAGNVWPPSIGVSPEHYSRGCA